MVLLVASQNFGTKFQMFQEDLFTHASAQTAFLRLGPSPPPPPPFLVSHYGFWSGACSGLTSYCTGEEVVEFFT